MIRIRIESARPLVPQLSAAVEAIRRGEVVAFPTDTLYGLAVDPRSDAALDALFALKARSAGSHGGAHRRQRRAGRARWPSSSATARRLADRFWPGPLTLVVPARGPRGAVGAIGVWPGRDSRARPSRRAGAGRGVRPCDHGDQRQRQWPGRRRPCPTRSQRALPGLAVLVDAGPSPGGPASTLVDASTREIRLLREGALPWSRVLEFLSTPS